MLKNEAAHISSYEFSIFPGSCPISRFWRGIWYTIPGVGVSLQRWLKIMQTKPGLLIAFILNLVFVAACGQKGPLFLPGSPSEIQSVVREQQPVVEESEQDDEDEDKDKKQTNPIN